MAAALRDSGASPHHVAALQLSLQAMGVVGAPHLATRLGGHSFAQGPVLAVPGPASRRLGTAAPTPVNSAVTGSDGAARSPTYFGGAGGGTGAGAGVGAGGAGAGACCFVPSVMALVPCVAAWPLACDMPPIWAKAGVDKTIRTAAAARTVFMGVLPETGGCHVERPRIVVHSCGKHKVDRVMAQMRHHRMTRSALGGGISSDFDDRNLRNIRDNGVCAYGERNKAL